MAEARPEVCTVVGRAGLDQLIEELRARGYRTRGPIVREGAVVHGPIERTEHLPVGIRDEQTPGHYALVHHEDDELFGWAVGPHSMKGELFPSHSTTWLGSLTEGRPSLVEPERHEAHVAFVGARPCEVAAEHILARVLVGGSHRDAEYVARAASSVVVVAECSRPSGSCFCAPMGSGPGVEEGFDLALTELSASGEASAGRRYLLRAGSSLGTELVSLLGGDAPTEEDWAERAGLLGEAADAMRGRFFAEDVPELLEHNLEHPEWDAIADRCLSCGNCTMVCPTCFCSSFEDTSALDGSLERTRRWSSCFEVAHSYLHGGAVRPTTASRYRQWATHKLSTWHQQFGSSGCVGCGRCITWCPVGIDLTATVATIRSRPGETRGAQ